MLILSYSWAPIKCDLTPDAPDTVGYGILQSKPEFPSQRAVTDSATKPTLTGMEESPVTEEHLLHILPNK